MGIEGYDCEYEPRKVEIRCPKCGSTDFFEDDRGCYVCRECWNRDYICEFVHYLTD
jgi:hypothetical protein